MTAVPQTHTFAGGVWTSSEANSYIRDPIAFLMNKPAAVLRQSVAQSLTSGAYTALTFTTEDLDDDPDGGGAHSNSSNTSRYTAVYAGWYWCSGGASFVASAAGQRAVRYAVNGTAVSGSETFMDANAAFTTELAARAMLVFLNAGDYVELQAMQSSGGALNTEVTAATQSMFSVSWERLA